jgi:hypothetical protein
VLIELATLYPKAASDNGLRDHFELSVRRPRRIVRVRTR